MKLQLSDLLDYATGAGFLGTGGGGDPYIGRLMLRQEMEEGGVATIIDPQDLPDDALVVSTAGIGAPTVLVEKVPCVDAAVESVRAIERRLGRPVDAIISIEAGGINGTLPLVLAARMGLPIVDGDGMGRAFPELQMVTFGVYGGSSSPMALTSEQGDVITIEARSNTFAERLARGLVVTMGAIGQISLYPLSGAAIKRTCVPYTITLSLEIGRTIRRARAAKQDPFSALVRFFAEARPARHATVLYDGKVTDVLRQTEGGFALGVVTLSPLDGGEGACKLRFQNELLMAEEDGRILAMVPDLITVLDRETGEPVNTEALRFGQRVKVVAVSVPPIMRSPEALATFGPRVFGLDTDYIPLEELAPQVA